MRAERSEFIESVIMLFGASNGMKRIDDVGVNDDA